MKNDYNTFIISLPKRNHDRLAHLRHSLDNVGFEYIVWEAIENTDGRIGLIMTLQFLLSFCSVSSYNNVLILEDDAKPLTTNINRSISKCMSQLPEDYDMLYLGCNLFQKEEVNLYSENLIQVSGAAATHAIMYSKKGIKKALFALKDAEKNRPIVPVDMLYVKMVQRDGKCFCAFPMLFSQQNGYSDILKKEINYTKWLDERFEGRTNHLRQVVEKP